MFIIPPFMKLNELCEKNLSITKQDEQIYHIVLDDYIFKIELKKEVDFDYVIKQIQIMRENQSEISENECFKIIKANNEMNRSKDIFEIKTSDENFSFILPSTSQERIAHYKYEEKFLDNTESQKQHPDIFPNIDPILHKKKSEHRGMHMSPDDTFFKHHSFQQESRNNDDLAAPFAKYDPIFPTQKKYKGPNPDNLKKPGNFPDKDIF